RALADLVERLGKVVAFDFVDGQVAPEQKRFALVSRVDDAIATGRDESGDVEHVRQMLLVVPAVELLVAAFERLGQDEQGMALHVGSYTAMVSEHRIGGGGSRSVFRRDRAPG